jgi:hypothetical protein
VGGLKDKDIGENNYGILEEYSCNEKGGIVVFGYERRDRVSNGKVPVA